MQFWTLNEIEKHAMADHDVGEELSPGVTITRRRILQFGVAGMVGLMTAGCSTTGRNGSGAGVPTASPLTSEQPLTIEQLLSQLRPEAKRMIAADQPDESSYLDAASKLLARYEPDEPWAIRDIGDSGWRMNPVARVPPIIVFDIHMRPGSKIHLHDHRHYNGVLQCQEGSVRCRNFDIVQPDGRHLDIAAGEVPPTGEDFLIRQNKDSTLTPGQLSTLSRDRDNIHHVEAGPDGCKLADLLHTSAQKHDPTDWSGTSGRSPGAAICTASPGGVEQRFGETAGKCGDLQENGPPPSPGGIKMGNVGCEEKRRMIQTCGKLVAGA